MPRSSDDLVATPALLRRSCGTPSPTTNARSMVEGIVYRYRTGIAWRDLPRVFGPWQTVWAWHRRLARDGTWDRTPFGVIEGVE